MEKMHFGHVVQSVAGRDRFRVFIVIGTRERKDGTIALVANGTLHLASDAKVKNPRHLKVIAELTEAEKSELSKDLSDGKLRELCDKYDNFPKKIRIPLDKAHEDAV